MDFEMLRAYCLAKKHVTERFPFDEHTLVFYVADKMFALTGLDEPDVQVNLKCDPERSIELREKYYQITAGFHMNKTHWNTVRLEGLGTDMVKELIDHSYQQVVKGFSKKKKIELDLNYL